MEHGTQPELDAQPIASSPDHIPKTSQTPTNEEAKENIEPRDGDNSNKSGATRKSVSWSPELVSESPAPAIGENDLDNLGGNAANGSNPYVTSLIGSAQKINFKETVGTVRNVLWKWGKMVGEATKKAEDLTGNTWQHLKTAPTFTDGALGRLAQGAKVLADGGYEKIFTQTFETSPEEQLINSFACYLSTSAGPVMGIMYISSAKIAFCSDNPLSYKSGDETEWSYYKVVIPLHQLKAVNPSSSKTNTAEKYIQVISVDNHEFWFMGFLNYNNAVKFLLDASQAHEV